MARRWAWLCFLVVAVAAACGEDSTTNNNTNVGGGGGGGGFGTQVTADITVPTTWTTGTTYVVTGPISVTSALTIQPGTIVKFNFASSLHTISGGTIMAVGTAGSHIVFTSAKDDAHGGDANGDGSATAPAPSDWAGVHLLSPGSSFAFCEFQHAGQANSAALSVAGGSASVTNSVFAHNGSDVAIDAVPALDASSAAAGTVITGNTFFANVVPLGIGARLSLDDSNAFDNSAAAPLAPQPSTFNAVVFAGCDTVTGNISWTAKRVPFVIGDPSTACNDLKIGAAGHLTLGPDVVLKLFPDGFVLADGVFTVAGAAGHEVVLTSIRDDSRGGDTNHDAAATTPAPGDWGGVSLGLSGSRFDSVRIQYAGQAGVAALWTGAARVTVASSVFAFNGDYDGIDGSAALDASSALAPSSITSTVFYGNKIPLAIHGDLSLDDSNSFDNSAAAPLAPQPNTFNAVVAGYCSAVTSAVTWSLTKVPFMVGTPSSACGYLDVAAGGHLTLGPNVILKFFLDGKIDVAAGGVVTTAAGDQFTSIQDDLVDDTNADGTATAPGTGDWLGIILRSLVSSDVCKSDSLVNAHYATAGCGL